MDNVQNIKCCTPGTYNNHRCMKINGCVRVNFENDYKASIEPILKQLSIKLLKDYSMSKEDTEDILQDSLFKLFSYYQRDRNIQNLKSFFFTTVKNRALDLLKSKSKKMEASMSDYIEYIEDEK